MKSLKSDGFPCNVYPLGRFKPCSLHQTHELIRERGVLFVECCQVNYGGMPTQRNNLLCNTPVVLKNIHFVKEFFSATKKMKEGIVVQRAIKSGSPVMKNIDKKIFFALPKALCLSPFGVIYSKTCTVGMGQIGIYKFVLNPIRSKIDYLAMGHSGQKQIVE